MPRDQMLDKDDDDGGDEDEDDICLDHLVLREEDDEEEHDICDDDEDHKINTESEAVHLSSGQDEQGMSAFDPCNDILSCDDDEESSACVPFAVDSPRTINGEHKPKSSSLSPCISSPLTSPSTSSGSSGKTPHVRKRKACSSTNTWTNDFDSAASFEEYMARLAPPTVSRSTVIDEKQQLDMCLQVVMNMMTRRGFYANAHARVDPDSLAVIVDDESLLDPKHISEDKTLESEEFFGPLSVKKNDVRVYAGTRDGNVCLIIYGGAKVCVQAARDISQLTTRNLRLDTIIIISMHGATPIANKELLKVCTTFYQVFEIAELLLPYVDHQLNPKHRVLSPAEKIEFLKRKMVLDEKRMPIMHVNDAFAKFYGFRVGQIVELTTRLGGSLGTSRSYKLVDIGD
jgi:DNA-directed RNA polymerase subunit H (RpoH/RPB5)